MGVPGKCTRFDAAVVDQCAHRSHRPMHRSGTLRPTQKTSDCCRVAARPNRLRLQNTGLGTAGFFFDLDLASGNMASMHQWILWAGSEPIFRTIQLPWSEAMIHESNQREHWSAITGMTCLALFTLAVGSGPVCAELLTGTTTTGNLVTFDSATPGTIMTTVGVTGLQTGETLLGIDRRPASAVLYGLGSTSRLYTINTTTGAATQVGSAGAFALSGTAFGFDFNPTVDRIRVSRATPARTCGSTRTTARSPRPTRALAYAAGDPNASATPRVVGSAYTNNFPGAVTTTLYGIDSNLDVLVTQGSPGSSPVSPNSGQLFTIGALGFNTSDLVGFDISGLSGVAYASMTAPGGNASQLFTINLNDRCRHTGRDHRRRGAADWAGRCRPRTRHSEPDPPRPWAGRIR